MNPLKLRLLQMAGDHLLVFLSVLCGHMLRFGGLHSFIANDYLVLLIFSHIAWSVVSNSLDLYEPDRKTGGIKLFVLLLRQFALYALLLVAFNGLIKTYYSRLALVYGLSFMLFALPIWRFGLLYWLKQQRKQGRQLRNLLAIGYDSGLQDLLSYFQGHPEFGFRYLGFLGRKEEEHEPLGTLDDLHEICQEHQVQELYAFVSALNHEEIQRLVEYSENNLIRLHFIPETKGMPFRKLAVEYYDYVPVLQVRPIPLDDPANRLLKRLFDFSFSLLVILLLLSWLLPVLAIIIRINSRGPIFFRQKRSGKGNEEFWCYKLRSMYVHQEDGVTQARKGDSRITPVGRWLRKTSLDELPQFFNVLIGNMSVVGPRPHAVAHTEAYAPAIDKYMLRHIIKPGITGLSQVMGYRGETDEEYLMRNRVRIDIFYLENWTFWLDLKIIYFTLRNGLKGEERAY